MGVYIKGMEMPKSCYACMFFAQADYWSKEDEADILSHCKRTGEKTWESVKGYLPNCPLVPVQPHGRLIDADALIDKVIAKYLEHERMGQLVFAAAEIKQDICDLISDAPTIIPAEEGE